MAIKNIDHFKTSTHFNQMDFRELYTYDLGGKLVQAYYECNPNVMTSSGFGSVTIIMLQLAG
jgi:hypothetical protein